MIARLPAQVLEMNAQASPLRRLPRPDEVAAAITGEIVRVGCGAT
jgi:hypothetical protein